MQPGDTFRVPYPFLLSTYTERHADGDVEVLSWRPGSSFPRDHKARFAPWEADGEGHQLLTVVSIHKPGKYPERVFYTQQWEAPDGKVFGATKLRMTTRRRFESMLCGYRYPYVVKEGR